MAVWLWQFWAYSFVGLLLEKAFALAVRSERRERRCFLLLPLCPVYGLGVWAVLALPPSMTDTFWGMALWGGAAATAVEYLVHFLYERLLGVRFWDYREIPGNLGGRICLPFSAAWGLLLAVGLPPLQARLLPLLRGIPVAVTIWMLVLFTADAVLSAWVLRQTGDPESVRIRWT